MVLPKKKLSKDHLSFSNRLYNQKLSLDKIIVKTFMKNCSVYGDCCIKIIVVVLISMISSTNLQWLSQAFMSWRTLWERQITSSLSELLIRCPKLWRIWQRRGSLHSRSMQWSARQNCSRRCLQHFQLPRHKFFVNIRGWVVLFSLFLNLFTYSYIFVLNLCTLWVVSNF